MFEAYGISDSQTIRSRNQFMNFTTYYDLCQQTPMNYASNESTTYMKYKRLTSDQAELIMKPVYAYDYIFDKAEVYSTTWERKKIQFIN